MDLVQWLGVQLDTDERIARAVQQPDDLRWEARHMAGEEAEGAIRWDVPGVAQPTHEDPLNKARMEHIAEHDPARVLREIEGARELLGRYKALAAGVLVMTGAEAILSEYRRVILPNLALPYADRPCYVEALASVQ